MPARGPLSFAQQRMLRFVESPLDPIGFHLIQYVELEGDLDAAALETALARVTARHPALRTAFRREGGELGQEVDDAVELDHVRVDLRHFPDGDWPLRLDAMSVTVAARAFDLARPPLFRTALVRLPGGRAALVLVFHHVLTDGYGLTVFFRDLSTAYEAALEGVEPTFAEPPGEPIAYARWQRERLESERARLLDHWRSELDGADLSTWLSDRPRDIRQTRGRVYREHLPPETNRAVSELAAAVPATPFAAFVTAFGYELARRGGRREVVLTSNVSNRVRREHENLLALLANNLPFRLRFDEGATFRDAVRATGRTVLRTLDRQELPFAILIDEILAPAGPLPRFPSVQLAFPGELGDWGLVLPGVRSNVVDVPPPGARGDLLFYVDADEDGFFCAAVYDENVVAEEEIAELVSDFGATLRRAAADPDAPADPVASATEL
jgi:condensation domain-containing protein